MRRTVGEGACGTTRGVRIVWCFLSVLTSTFFFFSMNAAALTDLAIKKSPEVVPAFVTLEQFTDMVNKCRKK